MSRRVQLLTAALTALTELLPVTQDEFDQLPEDQIRQQLCTARALATSLTRLLVLPSISRQGTPAPLEQNPGFQQLQQRVQNYPTKGKHLPKNEMHLQKNAMLSVRYGAPFLTNGAPRAGY